MNLNQHDANEVFHNLEKHLEAAQTPEEAEYWEGCIYALGEQLDDLYQVA